MDNTEGLDTVLRSYRPQDLETASIRSAAPSYVSEAPSYHTTVSNGESIPPYSPPTNNTAPSSTSLLAAADGPTQAAGNRTHSLPTLLPSNTAHISTPGLPPIPPAPRRTNSDLPTLGAFSIPSWSAVNTNPTYQRVATRRAQAAMSSGEGLLRNAARVLDRVNEEGSGSGTSTPNSGGGVIRPLEDPYLVGEVAAARARRDRLARENGPDVLQREDRRWDWFLAQQNDWDERERSWKQFRSSMASSSGLTRGRLARRFTAGGR
ncbi:hypothetical protein N0V82_005595 [Gnomoniopsis sp. IMI 355080]|nr:hypothetical protein N0V82_005595 [Gnomoniopsis sp. IMI 355080]